MKLDGPGSGPRERMRSSFRWAARTVWNTLVFVVAAYLLLSILWGVVLGMRAVVSLRDLGAAGLAFLWGHPLLLLLLCAVAGLGVPARLAWSAASSARRA